LTSLRPCTRPGGLSGRHHVWHETTTFGFDYLRDNIGSASTSWCSASSTTRSSDEVDYDPDRRGADPADHLGAGRRVDDLYYKMIDHPKLRRGATIVEGKLSRSRPRAGDFIVDEKAPRGDADGRDRHCERR